MGEIVGTDETEDHAEDEEEYEGKELRVGWQGDGLLMRFPRPLRFLLSRMFSPGPPAQSPLVPMSEEVGSTGTKVMSKGADEEEGGNDDPEGESDSVTGLAHRVDGKITGDPFVGFSVGW